MNSLYKTDFFVSNN